MFIPSDIVNPKVTLSIYYLFTLGIKIAGTSKSRKYYSLSGKIKLKGDEIGASSASYRFSVTNHIPHGWISAMLIPNTFLILF